VYQQNPKVKTSLKGIESREGETIERKLERMMKNGADLGETGEMIFTERTEGVIPETDIRSDRHEIAVDAADAMSQLHLTKRDERHNPKPKNDGGEQSTDLEKG
jgi:hypothetical protein